MTRKSQLLLTALALASGMTQAATRAPTATACDRECLRTLADNYVAALVAHDPRKVPLATDIKFVENAQRMKPGEGLWKSTTAGTTEFKILVPDPYSQEVGGMVMIQSDGKPTQLGFRLKLVNGKITEAEHIVAVPREASLANLEKPRPAIVMDVPYEYRDSRGRLFISPRRTTMRSMTTTAHSRPSRPTVSGVRTAFEPHPPAASRPGRPFRVRRSVLRDSWACRTAPARSTPERSNTSR